MDKILIVDDEKESLKIIKDFCELKGNFEVYTAESGKQALEILKENQIPVIITDILMPTMNGYELCKTIREFDKLSVIIAITGYQSFFELTECRDIGFDDYLEKPLDYNKLIEIIKHSTDKVNRWKIIFDGNAKRETSY